MKQTLCSTLLVIAGLLALEGTGAAQEITEDRGLQGFWSVKSLERDGEVVPANGLYLGIKIYDDKVIFSKLTTEPRTLSYRTKRLSSPMILDVYDEQGEKLVMKGIFKMENGVLQICIGEPRPTEFETAPEDGRELFVLERRAKL